MTSQTPQEKEKFCGCCLDCGICPPKEGHDTFCPLYTPPSQEEKKETCCSGSTECTCLVKQPPQLAKEEKCQVSKCENLAEFEHYSSTLDGFGIKTGMMRLFKVCKEHSVEPPQPKEHLAQEEKVYFAPTPTAATESFLFDLFLKHELKEPETWEERWQKFIEELSSRQDNIGKMLAVSVIFKEEIGDFISQEITTTRLSAAAEERKRVCEEIKEKIRKKYITIGETRNTNLWDKDTAYNQALFDVISLIKNIKNSV